MSNSFVTPWTVAHQAPLSMGFPRQEYWSGLPFPSPGDLLDPEIEAMSPAFASRFFTTEPPRKPRDNFRVFQNWPQREKLLNILCLRRVMKIKKDGNHPKDNIIMNIHLKNKKCGITQHVCTVIGQWECGCSYILLCMVCAAHKIAYLGA